MIGIIGGNGAIATAAFVQRLVTQAACEGACQDHEFPPYILLSQAIPGFTDIELQAEQARQSLIRAIQAIYPHCDQIVIYCNTLHSLVPALQAEYPKVLDMLELCRPHLKSDHLGILCSQISAKYHIFDRIAPSVSYPNSAGQHSVNETILRGMRNQPPNPDQLHLAIQSLIHQGAQEIVIGCTELSHFNKLHPQVFSAPIPVIDTTQTLCLYLNERVQPTGI